jgi:LemA protein
MSKGTIGAIGCVGLLVLGLLIFGVMYVSLGNKLVGQEEAVNGAWSQVENAYQRRADLIPNLVATVQGAAAFEKSTLEAVTAARASVGRANIDAGNITNDPAAFARFEQAQGALTSALSRLMVVVERYPELKATQNFRDLQAQLEGTENRITVERMRYNETAQAYNTSRRQFPTSLIASLRGFKEKAYFKSQAGAEQAPKVEFNFGASPAPSPAR